MTQGPGKTKLPLTTIISVAAFLLSCETALIGYLIFSASSENLQLLWTLTTPKMSVEIANGRPELVVEYSLLAANWSTNQTAIVDLRCESGHRSKPDDDFVSLRFQNKCIVFQVDKGVKSPASKVVNLGSKQAAELLLVSRFPAPPPITNYYEEYSQNSDKFDDELFLLSLAEVGKDFFGNEFSIKHHYLQKSFGKDFCVGGSIIFDARSENTKLNWTVDYYVGRFTPIVQCPGKKRVVIESSVEFRRLLYNGSEPL
jgi:hypothetical protein